jgi:hypothetical protein
VGVSLQHVSDHLKWGLRSSMTWTDMCVVQVSTTRRSLPHTKDSEGVGTPRSITDSTEQCVWCLLHMWSTTSMLHVFSVICLV